MPDLIILVPTRGRPDNLARLWGAFTETCRADTVLLACTDDDDPALPRYADVVTKARADVEPDIDLLSWAAPRMDMPRRGPQIWSVTGPRLRLGGTLNAVSSTVAGSARRIGFMGDDHAPRSLGWDVRYIEALDRLGTGLVYGNDLIQGEALPTQVAMTADIIRATGHMVPPGLVHLWIDNAWLALGRALDAITYLPDVVVEHLHPIAGRAEWDQGYAEANADERSDADRAVFEKWHDQDLGRWVQQIREYERG